MTEANLEAFNNIVQQVARILFEHVGRAVPKEGWKCAHYHDTGNFSKLRIEMKDGTVKGIHSPTEGEFFDLMDQLWDIRSQFPDKWLALKLTILSNGKCDLHLSYDKHDPDFFRS